MGVHVHHAGGFIGGTRTSCRRFHRGYTYIMQEVS